MKNRRDSSKELYKTMIVPITFILMAFNYFSINGQNLGFITNSRSFFYLDYFSICMLILSLISYIFWNTSKYENKKKIKIRKIFKQISFLFLFYSLLSPGILLIYLFIFKGIIIISKEITSVILVVILITLATFMTKKTIK